MFITQNRPGQIPFETKSVRVVNRCGTTDLQVGDVVAFDLDASDPATQALQGVGGVVLDSLTEAMFHNVVEVGAAPGNALIGVVKSLLSGGGVDDSEVDVQISGEAEAKFGGTDFSVAFSSCGVAVMADTTGANRRLVVAVDGANRGKVGAIIEAIDLNLAAANQQLTKVWLNSWGSSVGTVGA